MKTIRAIDAWLFAHGSPTALAAFRVCFGLLSMIDIAMELPFMSDWFSEQGYVPAAASSQWLGSIDRHATLFGRKVELPFDIPRIDLLSGVTDLRLTVIFFVLVLVACILTTIGLWTKVSSIFLAIGVISLHHRNPLILNGGDTLMRLGLIYLALSACGARWSIDDLIARKKGQASAGQVPLWPQRLIQINLALIYFTTVWAKWGGHYWRNGTATWYTLRLTEFQRFPYPPFIRNLPWVYVSTYGTLIVELALATLVFARPLRKWVLLAGVAMHVFIDYSMNIPLFSFFIMAMYICFYSGDEVENWVSRVRNRVAKVRDRPMANNC